MDLKPDSLRRDTRREKVKYCRRIVTHRVCKYDENWPEGSRGVRVLHARSIACTFLWTTIGQVAHLSCTHRYPSTLNASTEEVVHFRNASADSRTVVLSFSLEPAWRCSQVVLFLFVHDLRRRTTHDARRYDDGAFTSPRPGTPEISYFTRSRSVSSCKWYENRVSTSWGPTTLPVHAVRQVSLPRFERPGGLFFRCSDDRETLLSRKRRQNR